MDTCFTSAKLEKSKSEPGGVFTATDSHTDKDSHTGALERRDKSDRFFERH